MKESSPVIYLDNTGILKLPAKVDLETGTVTIKDIMPGTREYVNYTESELKIIEETTGQISEKLHLVKKIFKGRIVKEL